MSNYIRPKQPGATVFFTVNLADRGSGLLVQQIETLRQAVRATRHDRPFEIDAWVVLPDHMHCIWTLPEGDADFSTRMGAIKARFSRDVRRSGFTPTPLGEGLGENVKQSRGEPRPTGDAPIWQKRFWEHHIRNEADWANHVHYCWINPVKHGLVAHPKDWPYSSWHRDA